MKRIDALWQSYRVILHRDVDATQVIETRRAFYAGAQALYHSIMCGLDPGGEPTDADMERMQGIHDELHEFAELVKNGVV